MSSSDAAPISATEHAYYMATAMVTTAFEYGRNDPAIWWASFRPHFVSLDFVIPPPVL
jgi:hypothetical protein